jgi:hypothetical protein
MPALHVSAAKTAVTPNANTQTFRCCGIATSDEMSDPRPLWLLRIPSALKLLHLHGPVASLEATEWHLGSYVSEEIDLIYRITVQEEKLVLTHPKQNPMHLSQGLVAPSPDRSRQSVPG